MNIFGKLALDGNLSDIAVREPVAWTDGATDVVLVAQPSFYGPYAYDAASKLAIPNTGQQSLNEQVNALQAIINGFGIQVPMETVDDIITTAASPPVELTGLSFGIKPNENWHAQWTLYCQGSAGGMKFAVIGPAGAVSVKFSADGNTTGIAARSLSLGGAFNTLTSIAFIANATVFTGKVQLDMHVANGPNAGTIKLGMASAVNGQSNRVMGRSFGQSWRSAV